MGYDVFISYNSNDWQIAEAVCHYIEDRRLRCFIAPRDITQPDWAGNISNAIESSRAFVIVVSEKSIFSNEVAKEVSLATRVSDYIFPFRIDHAELNGRMNYHLSAFHWIDAVTPPMEKRLNELADRVATALQTNMDNRQLGNLSGNRNTGMQRLLGQSVRPRAEFIGRHLELQQLHALLTSDVDAVFLTGMGGIGKSELAKAYAHNHPELYTTVVFASYETDLLHLIASDQAITVENLQQASATDGQGETTEAYFKRKMNSLRAIVNAHTLLIIDNFDVESDDRLEDVLKLPCKQIWTTRTDFSALGYETLRIGPMDDFEDLVKLMQRVDKVYPTEADRQALREIIHLLDCHTYAVSLTAAQMKAGRIKPQQMLSQLQEEGLKIQTRSSFAREAGQKKATAYEYIQALFDFSALDDNACDILRYMACMPREGVNIDLMMEVCGIDDFGDISRLVDLNWIQLDEENDRIFLHMLVREMVWARMTPTENNCKALLQGAMGWATNAWNKLHEENRSHSSIIFSLLETFPAPGIRWLDCFEELATFAWIQGRFDLAEHCELHLYSLCVDHYGADSTATGNQALRVAAVYHNQGDYVKARPWYEKGLQVHENNDPDSFEAYTARSKVARSNAQNGDYALAKKQFLQNLEFVQRNHRELQKAGAGGETLRRANVSLAFGRMNAARIYSHLGNFEKALPLAQLSYDYLKTDTVEPSLVIYALMVLLDVHQGLKNYAQALNYAQQALEANIRYHGEHRIDSMFLYEIQGDLLALQGQYKEACDQYARAWGGREKFYPADVKSIARLEAKIADTQQGVCVQLQHQNFWT